MNGIRKKRLGLRAERINRDWAVAKPFDEDRPLEHTEDKARPQINESKPCYNADPAEYEEVFKCHGSFTLTTGGTVYSPSRMASPGSYTRNQSMKLPEGAGSQLESRPVGVAFWM